MKLLSTTAILLLATAGIGFAAIDTNALVTDYQAQGYTSIDVRSAPTQVKVEAIRGTEKIEAIYDLETGALLKSEIGTVDAEEDDVTAGVRFRTRETDFLRDGYARVEDEDDDIDEADDDADEGSDDDSDEGSDDNDDGDDSGNDNDDGDDSGDDGDDSGNDGDSSGSGDSDGEGEGDND